MMIVSINQPAYLPWLGYFHRIAMSDLHIVLDHVQFEKNSFVNRNKVLGPNGPSWLTVPIKTKGMFGNLPIRDLEIVNQTHWQSSHWKTLRFTYGKCPYFPQYADFFEDAYARQWDRLFDLMVHLNTYILGLLQIKTPITVSSDYSPTLTKDQLVLQLCEKVGATTYISGALGRHYLKPEAFHDARINLEYQDYSHPAYPQAQSKTGIFVPYMCVVDLLFNCGPASRDIMMGLTRNP
jgi:hypothetical protein